MTRTEFIEMHAKADAMERVNMRTRLSLDRDLVRDLLTGWKPSHDELRQWERRLNEVLR